MPTLAEHQQQRTLLAQLRASDDPGAQQQAEQLQSLYYAREMAGLSDDVYDSAKGEGRPDAGWIRASEHPEKLREYASQLNLTDKQITELLKPGNSGFRAEIYLPDPAILGPGYKPSVAFKGSAGEVLTPDGLRDTGSEDFIANNFPQSVGLKTDYYDRAMRLGSLLKDQKLDFDITGHSLGGGMASAAAAVTGARTTTYNGAGLHPLTAQRFAEENGLRLYDTRQNVTAYQVAGEVLNDGIQQNIQRLDAFRRQELGAVLKETSTILQELPHSKALLASQLDAGVPRHAQPSVHAFLDRLQHGDTAQLLRELPLAAGQPQPLLVARQHAANGEGIVDRPARLSVREASNFAGPALDALYATSQGVRLGRSLGGVVAQSGQLAKQGLDASGDLTQRAAQAAAQLRQDTSQLLGAVAAQGVQQAGAVAAQGRQALGQAEAGIDRMQGQVQGEAAALGAAALRNLGGILPQGLSEQVTAQAQRLAQAGAAAQQRGQQEAAQALHGADAHAQQIRQHSHGAGQALDAAVRQVGQAESAVLAGVGTIVNTTLDTGGRSIQAGAAMAPELYAAQSGAATAVVGTAAIHNPMTVQGLANLVRTGVLADKVSGSFAEATERHLMTETVVPSMDARIQGMERNARELLAPERTAPTHTPTPTPAQPQQQPGPDTPHQQQHALEQQRQWQLLQDQILQQGRGRVAEQETAQDGPHDRKLAASAIEGAERTPHTLTLHGFSDPAHPGHALYADVKDRLEAKGTPLPEDRLNQVTATMYIIGFKPDWRGRVDVVDGTFYAQHSVDPTRRMSQSLAEPTPSIQESMQQVYAYTQETARQQQASLQAQRSPPVQPGPVMG